MRSLTACGILLLILLAPALIAADHPVGFVVSFSGDAEQYEIRRGNNTMKAAPWLPLYANDLVSLRDPGKGSIILSMADEPHVVVDSDKPSLRVRPTQSILPKAVRNLIGILAQAFERDREYEDQSLGTRTRDLAYRIAGLAEGSARVVEGQRKFGIAWDGGIAPFHVVVMHVDGEKIADEANIPERELVIVTRDVQLKKGRYLVFIADKTKRRIEGSFETVIRGPDVPDDIAPEGAQANLKSLLSAAWLSHSHRQEFSYEAYLRLLTLIDDPALAPTAEVELREIRNGVN
jgi:hypothetical protein